MASAKQTTAKHTGAKKVAAKKAASSKADAERPAAKKAPVKKVATKKKVFAKKPVAQRRRGAAATTLAGYDPRAQLDKLSPSPPDASTCGTRATAAPTPRLPDEFYAARKDEPLGDQAMAEAAQALGCEVAAVRAVAEVESRGSGFDAQGRPTILYERHVFARNTAPKGRFNAQFPDISFGQPY